MRLRVGLIARGSVLSCAFLCWCALHVTRIHGIWDFGFSRDLLRIPKSGILPSCFSLNLVDFPLYLQCDFGEERNVYGYTLVELSVA